MDNRTWLDKEKLLNVLGEYGECYHKSANESETEEEMYYALGRMDAYSMLRHDLKSGTFDAPEANQLREENAKLVKALEWIENGRMYGNEAAECARQALRGGNTNELASNGE